MRSCYLLSSFHIVHNQFEIKGSVLGLGEAPVALGAHVAQGATVTRARRFWKFFLKVVLSSKAEKQLIFVGVNALKLIKALRKHGR